jgi:dihydroorotate dehydrogenase electron transfer subunit
VARQRAAIVADQRAATERLRWLTLQDPDLAREVRPGQFVMLRCAGPGVSDPPLRRALFVAAAEPALGQVALLYAPGDDPGLGWLTRARGGDPLDLIGPLGHPFQIDQRTRALVLVGEGPGLAALMFLAQALLRRQGAVTLLAAAPDAALLPPPFLMPDEVEYQSAVGSAVALLEPPQARSMLTWADQLCGALPSGDLARLRDLIGAARIRSDRDFASVLVAGAIPCGLSICGACAIETRRGARLLCSDGPVFSLRDLVGR